MFCHGRSPIARILFLVIATICLCKHSIAQSGADKTQAVPLLQWAKFEIVFVEKTLKKTLKLIKQSQLESHLRKYTKDFYETVTDLVDYAGRVDQKVVAVVRNPIASFRMLWRLHKLLPEIRRRIDEAEKFKNAEILDALAEGDIVNWANYNEAMEALFQIQITYLIHAAQFADGEILEQKTGTKLNAVQCYELGVHAVIKGTFILGVEWLEVALAKAKKDRSMDITLISTALETAIRSHDYLRDRREPDDYEQLGFFKYDLKPMQSWRNFTSARQWERQVLAEKLLNNENITGKIPNITILAWETCRNYTIRLKQDEHWVAPDQDPLYCWLSSADPYWTLSPLKVEALRVSPEILQIHDLLTSEMIEAIKRISDGKMLHATLEPGEPYIGIYQDRKSSTLWINEWEEPTLQSFSRLSAKISGFFLNKKMAAENVQIARYNFGDYFHYHHDAIKEPPAMVGNRLATIMFYLESPDLGGRTLFLPSNVSPSLEKGSVLMWHDVYANEELDLETSHMACPVIIGEKWIATKWISMYDQFLRRKCPVNATICFKFPLAIK